MTHQQMERILEAALTEARTRIKAADRMAEALERLCVDHACACDPTNEARFALNAYRKETGQ